MRRVFNLLSTRPRPPVVVVSGLPRSGTSLMMQMLAAGGLPVLSDGLRRPDGDNPNGYYEFERAKRLPAGDTAWLPEGRGKAVKIISALLVHLPPGYDIRVLFMRRDFAEMLASQQEMLRNRSEPAASPAEQAEMARQFARHLAEVQAWMGGQPRLEFMEVDYNRLIAAPLETARAVQVFLGLPLEIERMAAAVNPALYRQRRV
jgi:hypothetical protein